MTDELVKDVAGLKVQMEMMINILRDIQKDLRENHMPLAQIEEKFKNQGERIGILEIRNNVLSDKLEKTVSIQDLSDLETEVNKHFAVLAIEEEKRQRREEKAADIKRESPYKLLGAISVLVVTCGAVVSAVSWFMTHFK